MKVLASNLGTTSVRALAAVAGQQLNSSQATTKTEHLAKLQAEVTEFRKFLESIPTAYLNFDPEDNASITSLKELVEKLTGTRNNNVICAIADQTKRDIAQALADCYVKLSPEFHGDIMKNLKEYIQLLNGRIYSVGLNPVQLIHPSEIKTPLHKVFFTKVSNIWSKIQSNVERFFQSISQKLTGRFSNTTEQPQLEPIEIAELKK